MLKRIQQAVKNQNWTSIFIELILLIIGLSIAYQLNVRQEINAERKQKKALIENIKIENQINLEEESTDLDYRTTLGNDLYTFHKFLGAKELNIDSISVYLPILFRSTTSIFTKEYLKTYLNGNYAEEGNQLTSELINLDLLMDGVDDLTERIWEYKMENIYQFLMDAVDYYEVDGGKLTFFDEKKFQSLEFKNKVILLAELEYSLSDFINETLTQMKKIEEILETY